jgi:hypothetical protein
MHIHHYGNSKYNGLQYGTDTGTTIDTRRIQHSIRNIHLGKPKSIEIYNYRITRVWLAIKK